jgi:hypothetical protein
MPDFSLWMRALSLALSAVLVLSALSPVALQAARIAA